MRQRRHQRYCKVCSNKIHWESQTGLCKICFNHTKKKNTSFVCKGCDKEVFLPPTMIRWKNGFCSKKCKAQWKKENNISKKVKVNCNYCGSEIEKYPSVLTGKNHFCCHLCNSLFHARERYKDHVYTLDLRKLVRRCGEYKRWKRKILERNNFKCEECGSNKDLHIHHKYPFAKIFNEFTSYYTKKALEDISYMYKEAQNFERFWDLENGIVLCRECHQKIHPNLVLTH